MVLCDNDRDSHSRTRTMAVYADPLQQVFGSESENRVHVLPTDFSCPEGLHREGPCLRDAAKKGHGAENRGRHDGSRRDHRHPQRQHPLSQLSREERRGAG